MDKLNIKNKIILVCGGSGQVGRSIIKYLLNKKAIIINFDINTAKNISDKNYLFLNTNLTNEKTVKKNVKKISKIYGKIDGMVNLFHYKGNNKRLDNNHSFFNSFENYSFSNWKKVINVNLNGLFLISKYVIKEMKKNKKGTIVNFSSTYGVRSPKHNIYGKSKINSPIAYATTKSAIINFSRYLSTYYGKDNIRVNVVSPGGIETKGQSKEFKENYNLNTPMQRLAKDYEFNEIIHVLLSDASSYMTGANISVDGGWTAW